jgi:hypothetical protein
VYVEGLFLKWLFGFKNTVESLIKKDGHAYVRLILDAMMDSGNNVMESGNNAKETSETQKHRRKSSSMMSPSSIRLTPMSRLTPPPKKNKKRNKSDSFLDSNFIVIGLLMVLTVLLIYSVYLQSSQPPAFSFGGQLGGAGADSYIFVEKLEKEIQLMKAQLQNLEELIKLLKN